MTPIDACWLTLALTIIAAVFAITAYRQGQDTGFRLGCQVGNQYGYSDGYVHGWAAGRAERDTADPTINLRDVYRERVN